MLQIPCIGNMKKYFLRLGLPLLAVFALMFALKPGDFPLLLYKTCQIVVGIIVVEVLWVIAYKPIFGPIERMESYERRSVLIFRGLLYIAVILGIAWGL